MNCLSGQEENEPALPLFGPAGGIVLRIAVACRHRNP